MALLPLLVLGILGGSAEAQESTADPLADFDFDSFQTSTTPSFSFVERRMKLSGARTTLETPFGCSRVRNRVPRFTTS